MMDLTPLLLVRRARAFVLALGLTATFSPPASAQHHAHHAPHRHHGHPPPPTPTPAPVAADVVAAGGGNPAAASAFQRGLDALDQQRFAEAYQLLNESVALEATPRSVYNLGLAARGAGHYLAAVDALERYLASPEPSADAARIAAVRETVATLRSSLAHLFVDAPVGSVARLDGQTLAALPQGLAIDPGDHLLEVAADGYHDVRRSLAIGAGATERVQVDLRPVEEARLAVETIPENAAVLIDGVDAGRGRVERRLNAGTHLVEVRAPDHQPFRQTVRLGTQGLTRLPVTLVGVPRASHGWVLPTALAGGVLAVTGAVLLTVWLTRGTAAPESGTWATATATEGP